MVSGDSLHIKILLFSPFQPVRKNISQFDGFSKLLIIKYYIILEARYVFHSIWKKGV